MEKERSLILCSVTSFGKFSDIFGSKFLNFSNICWAHFLKRGNIDVDGLKTELLYKAKALLMCLHITKKSEE